MTFIFHYIEDGQATVLLGPIIFLNSPLPGIVRVRGNTRKDLEMKSRSMLMFEIKLPQALLVILYVQFLE